MMIMLESLVVANCCCCYKKYWSDVMVLLLLDVMLMLLLLSYMMTAGCWTMPPIICFLPESESESSWFSSCCNMIKLKKLRRLSAFITEKNNTKYWINKVVDVGKWL